LIVILNDSYQKFDELEFSRLTNESVCMSRSLW